MSHAPFLLWINQYEGDLAAIYEIPLSLFGSQLPELSAFVTAVTQAPRKDDTAAACESDEDDATEHPSEGEEDEEEGECKKNERAAASKRAKVDPVAKAFRHHVDATEYMQARLMELGISKQQKTWGNFWLTPVQVVLSYGFEI